MELLASNSTNSAVSGNRWKMHAGDGVIFSPGAAAA